MLIDGFTIAAQIINFLILLYLLRRFLYGPIIRIMNERQAKIAAQVAEAERLKQHALTEAEAYRQQLEELHKKREAMLLDAKESAEAWRKDFLGKARQEIDQTRASWYRGIEAEQQAFIAEVRREISKQVYAVSRRALADLADAGLEQQIIVVFLRRLQAMQDEERQILIETILKSQKHIIVRSAFVIPAPNRQQIQQTLQQTIGAAVETNFEVNPALLGGIEMSIHEYKLAWTLEEYLAALEKRLVEMLGEEMEQVHAG